MFDGLYHVLDNNKELKIISETKLSDSFPAAQICFHGFSTPYRLDKKSKDGEILLYVWQDTPSRLLSIKSKIDIKTICDAINLR